MRKSTGFPDSWRQCETSGQAAPIKVCHHRQLKGRTQEGWWGVRTTRSEVSNTRHPLNIDFKILKTIAIPVPFWQLWGAPNSFSAGALFPGPCWGSLQRFPGPLAGLRGPILLRGGEDKGREGKVGGEGGREGDRRKGRRGRREGKGTPLTQIPGSAPATPRLYNTPPSIPAAF